MLDARKLSVTSTQKTNSRSPTLDIARGLSILLVVFAHSGLAQRLPETNQTIALFIPKAIGF